MYPGEEFLVGKNPIREKFMISWENIYPWARSDEHTKKMTKISTIGCTIHLRHKSKQKHTEAQQCIIPPGFP